MNDPVEAIDEEEAFDNDKDDVIVFEKNQENKL
jgi:hypothetical protein